MTIAAKRRHSSSTDDKVEAKRKIIRKSLNEIAAEVASAMKDANLHAPISIVVPSRHSLVTITNARDLPPDEWSQMSGIVCRVLEQKLGGVGLRGRRLARAVTNAMMDAPGVSPD
jgi:hypothetical protein